MKAESLPARHLGEGKNIIISQGMTCLLLASSIAKETLLQVLGADNPFGLKVGSVWCHSLWDSVGLQVSKMEILAPEESNE